MGKKKKTTAPEKQQFNSSPFRDLKGFAVPGALEEKKTVRPADPAERSSDKSFAEEMSLLGVERLSSDNADALPAQDFAQGSGDIEEQFAETEDEQFLQAMGELQVEFSDSFPASETPPAASARRLKQLKQGKLTPQATLDLHGMKRLEVAAKLRFFLQTAERQNWQTLLIITGRGLHSDNGEPVVRKTAEQYLSTEGRRWVAEWGRAPKRFGGDGALVLFLRQSKK